MSRYDQEAMMRFFLIAVMAVSAGTYTHSWAAYVFVTAFAIWLSNLFLRVSQ